MNAFVLSRFKLIIARWEALKKRINIIIYNLSGKTAITENVMINEEEIISPSEMRQVHATPEIPDLPPAEEDMPEPLKEPEVEVEKMVVEEIAVVSSPKELKEPPVTPKEEKKKRTSLISRFSFKRSKREASPKTELKITPKKKFKVTTKNVSVLWTERNVDGTLQQIRISFQWVKFKLVSMLT